MARKSISRKTTAAILGERAQRLVGSKRPGEMLTKEQRLARGAVDFDWFKHYYLADYFTSQDAKFHSELSELIDTQSRVAAAAPREHAKSTNVSFAKVIQQICHQKRHFVVLIRESQGIARANVDDIRQELESNERIREDFGDLMGGRKWAEDEFVTSTDIKIVGRGRGQSMRGMRHKQYRPDLIICDDIEDDESCESKEQREKQYRWFRRVVMNLGKAAAIFVIGTILHHDSLLSKLLKRDDIWMVRIWRAIQDDGKPLWPAVWPLEALEKKKLELGSRDFGTEFMNEPANEEDQIFRRDWFKRFTDDDVAGLKMIEAGAIDPAIGLKQKNDETAAGVMGVHEGRYYLLKLRMKRLKMLQQVELIIGLCLEFPKIRKFGIETIAYQQALKETVEEESRKRNLQLPISKVEDISTDKIRRLGRLAPLAEQGLIYFPAAGSSFWSPDVEKCIEQFEQLGVSANAHDDGPDCIERCMSLLRGKTAKGVRAWLS